MTLKSIFGLLLLGLIPLLTSADPCSSVEFVTRQQWGAEPASSKKIKMPVGHVFIHHTEGPACANTEACKKQVKGIQNFHKNQKKWGDIGYNFLVGGDNKIYIGRGWDAEGAHTRGMNTKAIAICFVGSYTNAAPSAGMLKAAQDLIECGKHKNMIAKNAQLHGHRDQNCTSCPGNKLYELIKKWANFKGGKLPSFVC